MPFDMPLARPKIQNQNFTFSRSVESSIIEKKSNVMIFFSLFIKVSFIAKA